MPRIGRNSGNSSKEGSRGGNSIPKSMRGHKLAQRLPHLSKLVDGTLSSTTRGKSRSKEQTNTFDSAGTYKWKVPSGVDTVTVTMYGGGGGGGAGHSSHGGKTGSGGGGGAKVTKTITEIRPRTELTFVVGTGGASGGASDSGGNGGDTTFSYAGVNYVAGGGCGGGRAAITAHTGGSGGIGSGSGAVIVHGNTGHKGYNGTKTGSGGVALDGGAYGGYGQGGSGAMASDADLSVVGTPGAVVIT